MTNFLRLAIVVILLVGVLLFEVVARVERAS